MFAVSSSNQKESDNESDSDSDEIQSEAAQEIQRLIEKAKSNVIPEQSRPLYEKQYEKFLEWKTKMKLSEEITQNHLLAYFQKLSETYAATSLWATYSKLKSMLICKKNHDISKYLELQCFLKRLGKRHVVKKAMVFTPEEVSKFLNCADDDEFLLHKVILVIGLHGCLRTIELLNLKITDMKAEGNLFHIKIFSTKTKRTKSFVTSPEVYPIINKYMKLRPDKMERFFLQYRKSKCTRQNVGKATFSSIPKKIATYLKLDKPETYTGHALRRTSATLAADLGADTLTLQRLGDWKSASVAQSYVNESMLNKKTTSTMIASAFQFKKPSTAITAKTLSEKNQNDCAPSTSCQQVPCVLDSQLKVDQEKILENSQTCDKSISSMELNVIHSQYELSEEDINECHLSQQDYKQFFERNEMINQSSEPKNVNKRCANDNQDDKENDAQMNQLIKREKIKSSIHEKVYYSYIVL
ncbi:uncharacterized protein LOC111693663 [Trichogramma pretiosum]|uniref:uncharacterized protein LOC111693663 n=1 Tax=Trichogramma pretiosum TaxID=7493 RepID=UPI000C719AD0|nr:uncharacterized protein LOC111693663 [Trichogramma pretiosum]